MPTGYKNAEQGVSEWIEKTNAVGFTVKKGRYGGTYSHKDIAFEFGSVITYAVPVRVNLEKMKEEIQEIPIIEGLETKRTRTRGIADRPPPASDCAKANTNLLKRMILSSWQTQL